jgi:hypothetical protein
MAWHPLLYLFTTVNSPVISAMRMANCVFIGPSHKKIKFFVFFCRIIKRCLVVFIVLKSRFLQQKEVVRTVILDWILFCGKLRNRDPGLERNYENHSGC